MNHFVLYSTCCQVSALRRIGPLVFTSNSVTAQTGVRRILTALYTLYLLFDKIIFELMCTNINLQ